MTMMQVNTKIPFSAVITQMESGSPAISTPLTDVFVVSLFFAFLGASHDEMMDAKILVGVYFFAIYAFLSPFSSRFALKELSKSQPDRGLSPIEIHFEQCK